MNSIQQFRKVMGVSTPQPRLFQHHCFVDTSDPLCREVVDEYVDAMATVSPVLRSVLVPNNIGEDPERDDSGWQTVIDSGTQVLRPNAKKQPITLILVASETIADEQRHVELRQWVRQIANKFSEFWVISIGDPEADRARSFCEGLQAELNDGDPIAISCAVVQRIAPDGSVRTDDEMIQTAAHAMMVPVFCNTDGERVGHFQQSGQANVYAVEAAGVLASTKRIIQQITPAIVGRIIEATAEPGQLTFPTGISLLNQSVQGALPFDATPVIANRDDHLHDFASPCLYDANHRFTVSLFKPAEATKVANVSLRQRPKWLAEFARLVTTERVDRLSRLIRENLSKQFEHSHSRLLDQLSTKIFQVQELHRLGDKSKGLIASRQTVNFSAGEPIPVEQSLSEFEESIDNHRKTLATSMAVFAMAIIGAAMIVFAALRFNQLGMLWIASIGMPVAMVALSVRCFIAYRTMLRTQETVLEGIQREAQSRLCEQLHQVLDNLFGSLDSTICSGLCRMEQAGKTIVEYVNRENCNDLVSGGNFKSIPVSVDLMEKCCQLFVSRDSAEHPLPVWTPIAIKLVKSLGLKSIEGARAESVVSELLLAISRLLQSKLPPADLWRACSCNDFTEVDKSKLAEAREHCLQRLTGSDRTQGSSISSAVNIWFIPFSLRDQIRLGKIPALTTLNDRLVCLRITRW